MTGARAERGNPAPRVSTCIDCGGRFGAGPRGPLPHRCPSCRRPRSACHRIASALHAAEAADAPPDVIGHLELALRLARAYAGR